ncbi:MAG TPA: YfhO family protein [Patescibacteria group bacterium]
MKKLRKSPFLLFILGLFFAVFICFWQVFLTNKIAFPANLVASFYNPWAQEKYIGWDAGIPNKPTGKDDIIIFYPQRKLTMEMVTRGMLPYWDPYTYSGNYHLGLSETAVFYPLFLLFFFVPMLQAWTILVIIEPIIVGIGMWFFLRRLVSNSRAAALGAFAFAFADIVIVRSVEGLSVGHTLLWLPFAFWGIEAFFQTKRLRYLCITTLAFCFSILAGWFQFTFYMFALSGIYAFFKCSFNFKNKYQYIVFLPFILTPFLTMPHIFSSLLTLFDTTRSAKDASLFLNLHLQPITHIFAIFFPDYWGNPAVYSYFGIDYKESVVSIAMTSIIFAIFTIQNVKQNKYILFFWVTIFISLLIAIDSPISRFFLSLPIPIINTFIPDRIFLLVSFSLSVLSAYGFKWFLTTSKIYKQIFWLILIIWGIFIVFILFLLGQYAAYKSSNSLAIFFQHFAFSINHVNSLKEAIVQIKSVSIPLFIFFALTIIFIFLKKKYTSVSFFILIMILILVQQFLYIQKYVPFSQKEFFYSKTKIFNYLSQTIKLDRFESIENTHILGNFALLNDTYSPEGSASMYIKSYAELIAYVQSGNTKVLDRTSALLSPSITGIFKQKDTRMLRFFAIDGIKYIVVDKKSLAQSKITPDKNVFNPIWEDNTWKVFTYADAKPRAFFSSKYIVIPNRALLLNTFFAPKLDTDIILLDKSPKFTEDLSAVGQVTITKYTPNEVDMQVAATGNGLVFLSDNYSDAFKVYVDGKEASLLRADYTFRAVEVSKGNHIIRMIYQGNLTIPFVIAFGIAIAAIGFLIIFRKHF